MLFRGYNPGSIKTKRAKAKRGKREKATQGNRAVASVLLVEEIITSTSVAFGLKCRRNAALNYQEMPSLAPFAHTIGRPG